MLKNIINSITGKRTSWLFQQKYQPTQANLKARTEFQDEKFGMFIHFGLYSELGRGEWVMNNDKIPVNDYAKLKDFSILSGSMLKNMFLWLRMPV
jgi:alpha-L-fucosidase